VTHTLTKVLAPILRAITIAVATTEVLRATRTRIITAIVTAATIIPTPMEARIIILERAQPPTPLPAEPLRPAEAAAAKANLPANNF